MEKEYTIEELEGKIARLDSKNFKYPIVNPPRKLSEFLVQPTVSHPQMVDKTR